MHTAHGIHAATQPGSPLIRPSGWGACELPEPSEHTRAELATVLRLLGAAGPRMSTVTVGRGRDPFSRSAVDDFVTAWQDAGGTVLTVVDWPEEAASWLRQARRFVAGAPDAWVVAAAPRGWAHLGRRLRRSTGWNPERTVGFACLGDPRAVDLAGVETVEGMRGACSDGSGWQVGAYGVERLSADR